ncbi:conserved hypothetical protein [Arcobacter nitrofigilis DSM 7299]|uniref:Uncharacterized protein n=1 Tax=Arcobacter nitrofigilis (strain ATCC 33309 / DSM 7299 / CCUG 15893 / LMG 7604 / NCTC 12251 / CI) TaxID=572480 RepID=D5UZI5_ARCNC|nr:hypothetical protein [Arcobacter nitrofigilis]ADG92222.1 conserved hypothetical protein [Arcobacter nitrofigilis DSM 7299]
MSNNEILNYLKNAKIEANVLKKICKYFTEDYTAIQTAQNLNLSRQTINNYYKIIRNLLLSKEDEMLYMIKNTHFSNNTLLIKYIKNGPYINYFIECQKKAFIFKNNENTFPNLQKFIDNTIHLPLQNNKKANAAKISFNKKENKFTLLYLTKSDDTIQGFIQNRLKKFRGLNKDSLYLHLKESQFRYNYSQDFLYETLLSLLHLKKSNVAYISTLKQAPSLVL